MNGVINPEAAQPSGTQAFEQSDRNPAVTEFDGSGGQVPAPSSAESRMTPPSPVVPATAGLVNYDIGDTADSVEDSAEQEG